MKSPPTEKVEQLIVDCRRGAYSYAQSELILNECIKTLESLVLERDRLLRGEFICSRCGLRQDGHDSNTYPPF